MRCLGGRTRSRVPARVAGELLELLPRARVAEHHVVAGASKNCPELATHQTRTKNANPHASSPWLNPNRLALESSRSSSAGIRRDRTAAVLRSCAPPSRVQHGANLGP